MLELTVIDQFEKCERWRWKRIACETELLSVINQVPDNDNKLEGEPSPQLKRARVILQHIRNFSFECCTKHKRSVLVPETSDAARRWQTLLNYKCESCTDVKTVIAFRNQASQNPGAPTRSRLDDGFLKSKVAIGFHTKAEAFIVSIEIVQELESLVHSVEKSAGVMRATPLSDVDINMELDPKYIFNEDPFTAG